MSRAFTGAFNAIVLREGESTGSGERELLASERRRRQMDLGSVDDAAYLKARQKPPKRAWGHDEGNGATSATTDNLTICAGLDRGSPGSPLAW